MIRTQVTFTNGTTRVLKAVEEAKYKNLKHAAFSVRKAAADSIKQRAKSKHSEAGEPPHTHTGAFYRRALWVHVDKYGIDALIGFRESKIGEVAAIHEHARTEEGRKYPLRPTTLPALESKLGKFHQDWRASVG